MSRSGGVAQEWRHYWYLPLVAGLGGTATTIYAYGLGPFIEPIQQEFGWTRAQVMLGLTITNLPQILLLPLIGQLVDKWGPRRVGLIGVTAVPAAIALLGTATGSNLNWWALWALIALVVPFAQGSVWTTPVVGRFVAGRGMALAVTLSGSSLASAVMPVIATVMVAEFGWRHGISVFAGSWLLLMLVPVALFFRGPQESRRVSTAGQPQADPEAVPGLNLAEAARGWALYKLVFAAFTYTVVLIGTVIHLVPMLKAFGATPMQAAATAGLYGIFAIIGRLITGVLLDRFPSNIVGFLGYVLPVPGFLLLVLAGVVPLNQAIAVSLFGLAAGAQLNIFTYLIARHFGLKRYASLTSLVFGFVAVGSAVGPLFAGASFDRFGSYSVFMLCAAALTGAASLAVLSLGRPAYGQS